MQKGKKGAFDTLFNLEIIKREGNESAGIVRKKKTALPHDWYTNVKLVRKRFNKAGLECNHEKIVEC